VRCADSSDSLSILLIDGDLSWSESLADSLKRSSCDYRLLLAADGQSGLDVSRAQRIDCVVLELDLPDMSGFHILLNLIENASRPDVAIIILTRLANSMLREAALKQGAQAYLVKSRVSGEDLDKAIQAALAFVGRRRGEKPTNSIEGACMSSAVRSHGSRIEGVVDEAILSLRNSRRFVMFSDLADALPHHSWRLLFESLNRLARQRRVELVPHRRDYEVIFSPTIPTQTGPSVNAR